MANILRELEIPEEEVKQHLETISKEISAVMAKLNQGGNRANYAALTNALEALRKTEHLLQAVMDSLKKS